MKTLITCTTCVMVVTVLSYLCKWCAGLFAASGITDDGVLIMLQFSQCYDIAFCIVMLSLEYQNEKQLRTQKELVASHELLRLQEGQYHLTRENIDLINRKCHDIGADTLYSSIM